MSNEKAPQAQDAIEVDEQDLDAISGGQDSGSGDTYMKVNNDPAGAAPVTIQ